MHMRVRIDQLKAVSQICGALRARAEGEVERSNARLQSLGRQRDQQADVLKAQADGWEKAVTARSFQLTASTFWAAEVLRSRAAIAETEQAIQDGVAERNDLCEGLRSASARDDAVETLVGQAVRLHARRREEAALENHVGRKIPGWSGI